VRSAPRDTSVAYSSRSMPRSPSAASSLALQVGYDVALLELAAIVGIDSGPGRFEPAERERARLEAALGDLGIDLEL